MQTQRAFPLRDYLILPGLSLLTAVALLTFAEFAAQVGWPKQTTDSCLIHQASSGLAYQPNCSSRMKIPESSWVITKYNECGYRSEVSCLSKQPGSLRIAVLGASSAEGYMVSYEQSYTALTEKFLTQRCERPVDVQNLAVAGIHLKQAVNRTQEAVGLKPDLVLLVITPYDLWKDIDDLDPSVQERAKPPGPLSAASSSLRNRLDSVKATVRESSSLAVIRHFLYENPAIYLKFFLMSSQGGADFLQVPFSTPWRNGFEHIDHLLDEMKAQTSARGIPLAIVPSFHRPQVALLNAGDKFPGKDPYAFEREIATIARRHEILDLEVTEDFRQASQTQELFYLADGHLDPIGHEVLARSISRQIVQSGVFAHSGCSANLPSD